MEEVFIQTVAINKITIIFTAEVIMSSRMVISIITTRTRARITAAPWHPQTTLNRSGAPWGNRIHFTISPKELHLHGRDTHTKCANQPLQVCQQALKITETNTNLKRLFRVTAQYIP